jgi:hypothetical protein
VTCADYETYKQDVRKKLKEWITRLQERELEYLILYVNTQSHKKNTPLSLLSRSVLSELQNDFKTKIDR